MNRTPEELAKLLDAGEIPLFDIPLNIRRGLRFKRACNAIEAAARAAYRKQYWENLAATPTPSLEDQAETRRQIEAKCEQLQGW